MKLVAEISVHRKKLVQFPFTSHPEYKWALHPQKTIICVISCHRVERRALITDCGWVLSMSVVVSDRHFQNYSDTRSPHLLLVRWCIRWQQSYEFCLQLVEYRKRDDCFPRNFHVAGYVVLSLYVVPRAGIHVRFGAKWNRFKLRYAQISAMKLYV